MVISKNLASIIWYITHCLLFSILSAIIKHLLKHYFIFEIIFIETAATAILLLPWVAVRLKTCCNMHLVGWSAIRAFVWVMASSMYFFAITQITLSKAVAISFSVPLFTTLLAIIVLKEKIHIRRTVALIAGIIGMLVIVQPGVANYEAAALWVLGASFLWSITDIIIKVLGRHYDAVINAFSFSLWSAIFALSLIGKHWRMPSVEEVYWLTALTVIFPASIMSLSIAYQKTELTIIKPFAFWQLLFATVIAYVFFNEKLSLETVIGAFIIIASTTYMAYRERKIHRQFLAEQIGKKLIES